MAWAAHRRRLFDIAYRMLGQVSECEDVVQEAFLRLTRTGTDGIDDIEGWLITVTGRLCLDRLRRAATARVDYVGTWLPEPLVALPGAVGPEDRFTLDETIRMALLVVLDRLSPAERTSYLLHDVFGLPFDNVAAVVGRSTVACRQLASRARRRIAADPAALRQPPSRDDLEDVARRFAAACGTGRFDDLVAALDPDAHGEFDSAGVVPGAPLEPITGADVIARQLVAAFAGTATTFRVSAVNGEPGVIAELAGHTVAVMALVSDGRRILRIHAIGNPHKLQHITEPGR